MQILNERPVNARRFATLIALAMLGYLVPSAIVTRASASESAPVAAAKPPLQATAAERDARKPEDRQLEGSWDIVITTTPNPPFAVPFRILRTVTASGITDAYAFPSITPTTGTILVNSSGHGDWGVLEHGLYTATVKYFQLNPSNLNVLDSVGTVRENIRVAPDGNSYDSVFETTIALPNGTVIITNAGRTHATRIRPVPLQTLP